MVFVVYTAPAGSANYKRENETEGMEIMAHY